MTLYKSTIWKGTTAIGSLVLPVDDLNNLKNAGPLWCNLIQWNRKTHSIDSKGRALLRVLSNPTLVHSQDKKCESFVGNVSIHPNHICLPFGNQMSHHQMKLDTMERAHYEEATAPCLD